MPRKARVGRYAPFERVWPVGKIEKVFGAGAGFKAPKLKMPGERELKRMFKTGRRVI